MGRTSPLTAKKKARSTFDLGRGVRRKKKIGPPIVVPSSFRKKDVLKLGRMLKPRNQPEYVPPLIKNRFTVEQGGYKFIVSSYMNLRWKKFRTDRRMFRVDFGGFSGSETRGHLLLENIELDAILSKVIESVLREVRIRHMRQGLPRQAIAMIAISAKELEIPIQSEIGPLFSNGLVVDILEKLKLLTLSNKTIDLRQDGFHIDVTVIDDQKKEELFWKVGAGGKRVYRKDSLWESKRPAGWDSLPLAHKKFIKIMPSIGDKDPLFKDCCLLSAIAFSTAFNRNERKLYLGNKKDDLFAQMRHINVYGESSRCKQLQNKAARALRDEMIGLVEHYGLNVEVFRQCEVPSNALRKEVDKLKINLVIFEDSKCFRAAFQHPETYDDKLPTVHVCLMSFVRKVHHAASIIRPDTYADAFLKQGTYCMYCKTTWSKEFASVHRCSGKSTRCGKCKRVEKTENMYIDRAVLRNVCVPTTGFLEKCSKCEKTFYSKTCFAKHKLACRKDTVRCDNCGVAHRTPYGHVCGSRYCHTCNKWYIDDDSAGEQGHFCEMGRPSPSKEFAKMCFFDFESKIDGPHHEVNAVGFSFEEERGVFSEIYFYDDEMRHYEDKKEKSRCYNYKYWTSSLEEQEGLWKTKVPKYMQKVAFLNADVLLDIQRQALLGHSENEKDDFHRRGFFDTEAKEAASEESEDDEEEGFVEEEMDTEGAKGLPGWDSDFLESCDKEEFESDVATPCERGSALSKFVDFLLDTRFYNATLIAHCASQYDSHLLVNEIHARKVRTVPCFDGNRLLHLYIPVLKMRVIDSYRYIQMALARFPKRFPSIISEENVEKGCFPFFFNRPSSYEYGNDERDPVFPPREEFLDQFSSEAAEKTYEDFRASWPQNEPYVFKDEIHRYLQSDIYVLRAGCLRLCEEFFQLQEELNARRVHGKGKDFFHCFTSPYFTGNCFSFFKMKRRIFDNVLCI